MLIRLVCKSTNCLLWLILSLASASVNQYNVRIGQISNLSTHGLDISCPDEGSCAGDLELVLADMKRIPISIRMYFESGNAYLRFRMAQADLAVNGKSFYYMAIGIGRKSVRIGLSFPLEDFAQETRVPGLHLPVFRSSPEFAEIQIDVQPEK